MDGYDMLNEYRRSFNYFSMFLFLGREQAEIIPQTVFNQKWCCVLTTSRNSKLTEHFPADRKINHIFSPDDLKSLSDDDLLDKATTHIIWLSGRDDDGTGRDDDDIADDCSEIHQHLRHLFARALCRVVIADCRSEESEDIQKNLRQLFLNSPASSLFAFGAEEGGWIGTVLSRLDSKAKNPYFCTEPLGDLLTDGTIEPDYKYDISFRERGTGLQTIFAGGHDFRVLLTDRDFRACASYATPLTSEVVNMPLVAGVRARKEHFYSFLRDSVDAPQWEGYNPRNGFYVERNVQRDLEALVWDVLGYAANGTYGRVKPILLMGDPGSSKSITLGAVAYSIFQRREYPVVYITNGNLQLYPNGSGFTDFFLFNSMLKRMEEVGTKDEIERPVLIVWDGSLGDIQRRVFDLWNNLVKYKRNAVLLCSAYMQDLDSLGTSSPRTGKDTFHVALDSGEDGDHKYSYSLVSLGGAKDSSQEARQNSFYLLEAKRELDDTELLKFKLKLKEFADIKAAEWETIINKIDTHEITSGNLFPLLFYTLDYMQNPLRERVAREQDVVLDGKPYILEPKHQATAMENILRAAFMHQGRGDELPLQEKKIFNLHWSRLTICAALFTRFSVELPLSTAMSALCGTSALDMQLISAIRALPWLRFGTSGNNPESGNFILSYRTVLEAELYLNRIPVEDQANCLLDLLEYIRIYQSENNCVDQRAIRAINELLRKIGPNTKVSLSTSIRDQWRIFYPQIIDMLQALRFRKTALFPDGQADMVKKSGEAESSNEAQDDELSDKKDDWHQRLLALCEKGAPVDDLSLQMSEITFVREYYKVDAVNETTEECKKRLLKLKAARDLVSNLVESFINVKDLTRIEKHDWSILTVEEIHISRALWTCYEKYCNLAGEEREINLDAHTYQIRFEDRWDILNLAIQLDRDNSFNYVAMLYLFSEDFKQRFSVGCSTEIRQIIRANAVHVESVLTELYSDELTDPTNSFTFEQERELANLRNSFSDQMTQLDGGISVSIDSLREALRTDAQDPFTVEFRSALSKDPGSIAAAVIFVAQRELANAHIRYRDPFDSNQMLICSKVIDFLRDYDKEDYISSDRYGSQMLLHLRWHQLTGGAPIIPEKDGGKNKDQFIFCYLPGEVWEELLSYCEYFFKASDSSARYNWPSISYLRALCLAELYDYRSAAKELQNAGNKLQNLRRRNIRESAFYGVADLADSQAPDKVLFMPGVKNPPARRFRGHVASIADKNNGYMLLDGESSFPNDALDHSGVHFHYRNLGRNSMPSMRDDFPNLQLGLSFGGYTLHDGSTQSGVEGRA